MFHFHKVFQCRTNKSKTEKVLCQNSFFSFLFEDRIPFFLVFLISDVYRKHNTEEKDDPLKISPCINGRPEFN